MIIAAALTTRAWVVTAIFGGIVWAAAGAYYARLQYKVDGGIMTISSGVLFRRERIVPLEKVLVITNIRLGRECLLSVLTLSGCRVIVPGEVVRE